MTSDGDKRVQIVESLAPAHWDRKPLSLAHELRDMLKSVADEGTNIDSGGGDGHADLWVTVQGVEYYINISPSRAQLIREGKPVPEE